MCYHQRTDHQCEYYNSSFLSGHSSSNYLPSLFFLLIIRLLPSTREWKPGHLDFDTIFFDAHNARADRGPAGVVLPLLLNLPLLLAGRARRQGPLGRVVCQVDAVLCAQMIRFHPLQTGHILQ